MRAFGWLFTLLVIGFWLTMNLLVVRRENEQRKQGHFRGGLDRFLGTAYEREQWMSIYSGRKKVGFTGYTVEKILAIEGTEYQIATETRFQGRLPLPSLITRLFSDSNQLSLSGRLTLDAELEPTNLRFDVELSIRRGTAFETGMDFYVSGSRDGDSFPVEIRQNELTLMKIRLERERIALSNGLVPSLPLADYEIGKTYRIAIVDPFSSLGFDREDARVTVLARETRKIDGIPVDGFQVETLFRKSRTLSFVNAAGDVLVQELGPPFDLTLRLEKSARDARRGFELTEEESAERARAVEAARERNRVGGSRAADDAGSATKDDNGRSEP